MARCAYGGGGGWASLGAPHDPVEIDRVSETLGCPAKSADSPIEDGKAQSK